MQLDGAEQGGLDLGVGELEVLVGRGGRVHPVEESAELLAGGAGVVARVA